MYIEGLALSVFNVIDKLIEYIVSNVIQRVFVPLNGTAFALVRPFRLSSAVSRHIYLEGDIVCCLLFTYFILSRFV